jgi:hypothetical protein
MLNACAVVKAAPPPKTMNESLQVTMHGIISVLTGTAGHDDQTFEAMSYTSFWAPSPSQ